VTAFEWFLARKYFWAQRRNLSSGLIALFSALGVTLGTWLLIFVLSAINGFENEVKRQLMGKDAHIEITRHQFSPFAGYDSLRREALREPGVLQAAPFILSKTVIAHKQNQDGILVYGIDSALSSGVIGIFETVKRGNFRLGAIPDTSGREFPGILLGYALADRLGAGVGDKVFLADFSRADLLSGSFAPRVQPFMVSGVFESGMYQYDEPMAYVSLPAAQKLFELRDQATGLQLRVDDPYRSAALAESLEERLGFPFRAVDWQAKNYTLIKWMAYEKVLVGLALGIIIIIAAFNIISSLVMAVNDKTREIGILRAMGATRRGILRIFVFEGMLIGLSGSLIGTFLGLLSYWLQKTFGLIQLPGDVYFVTVLPVELKFLDVALVLFVTNFLCGVATLLPAFKAAAQDPVEAIRHE
jgi:lipoprotein-releasing system permease protein